MAIKFLSDLNLNGSELQSAALETLASNPASGNVTGQIYYNTTNNEVRIYNGSDYIVVGKDYSAGNGINLSGTTFSANANDGISVDANGISVDSTVLRTSGAQTKAGDTTFSDNVTISGNLTVNGTQTILNTAELAVEDTNITLNSGASAGANSGISVNRGQGADIPVLQWNETSDRWQFTNDGSTFYNIPTTSEYNNYSLPTASSTVLGGVKIGSGITITSGVISADSQTDNNFTNALLTKLNGIAAGADNYGSWTVSDGTNSETVGSGTTVQWRGAGATTVAYDASTNRFNISSTNTTYSAATSAALGLIKIGYTDNGKNYAVELDANSKAYVNVPWTDTNTTYSVATTSSNGLMSSTDKTKLDGIATNADNYGGWRISDGSTTEVIASGDTLTVSASGAASVSYDGASNTLTVSATNTNTQRSDEEIRDLVADVMAVNPTHVGISATDDDANNRVILTNQYNVYVGAISNHAGGDYNVTQSTAGVRFPANIQMHDSNGSFVIPEITWDATNSQWIFVGLPAGSYDFVITGKRA